MSLNEKVLKRGNFLESIGPIHMEKVCFEESFRILHDEDNLCEIHERNNKIDMSADLTKFKVIGETSVSFKKSSEMDMFQFDLNVTKCLEDYKYSCQLSAGITTFLRTIRLTKYETEQFPETTLAKQTTLESESDGRSSMAHLIFRTGEGAFESKQVLYFPARKKYLTEATSMILERILVHRVLEVAQLEVMGVNDEFKLCKFYYTTEPHMDVHLNNKNFQAFLIMGEMHYIEIEHDVVSQYSVRNQRATEGWIDVEGLLYEEDEPVSEFESVLQSQYATEHQDDSNNLHDQYELHDLDNLLDSEYLPNLISQRDSDSQHDLESQLDSDSQHDLESQLDSDSQHDLESQLDSDSQHDLESQLGSDSQHVLESQLDSDSQYDLESHYDADTESQYNGESQLGTGSQHDIESQLDTEGHYDAKSQQKVESYVDIEGHHAQVGRPDSARFCEKYGLKLAKHLEERPPEDKVHVMSRLCWVDSQYDVDSYHEQVLTWKSYFIKKSLFLYSVTGSQMYVVGKELIPDPVSLYYVPSYLTEGYTFLETIRIREWLDILFSEMKVTNFYGHQGCLMTTVEISAYEKEPCLLVLVSSHFNTGFMQFGFSCVAYMNFQLKPLYYQEQSYQQDDYMYIQKILRVHEELVCVCSVTGNRYTQVRIEQMSTNGKKVVRKIRVPERSFITPATFVLLERLYAKRKVDHEVQFDVLFRDDIYPAIIKSSPVGRLFSYGNSGRFKSFAIDCVVSSLPLAKFSKKEYFSCDHQPYVQYSTSGILHYPLPRYKQFSYACSGDILSFGMGHFFSSRPSGKNYWQDHFLPDQQLFTRYMDACHEFSTEVQCASHVLYTPYPVLDVNFHVPVYQNGREFLRAITISDLVLVSFNEALTIKTNSGEEVGTLNITVFNTIRKKQLFVIVKCYGSAELPCGTKKTIFLEAILDHSLATVKQVLNKTTEENDMLTYHSMIKVEKCYDNYRIRSLDNKTFYKWEVKDDRDEVPFLTDAAEIVLERLLIRKNLTDSLSFFNIDNSASIWVSTYSPYKKSWKIMSGGKLELFGIKKTQFWRNVGDNVAEIFFTKTGFLVERVMYDRSDNITFILSGHEHLEYLAKLTDVGLLVPHNVSSHDPVFGMSVDKKEIRLILFADDMEILSKTGERIGSFVQTVHHTYLDEQDVLLVRLTESTFEAGISIGIEVTAYINLNLEILKYNRCQYFKKRIVPYYTCELEPTTKYNENIVAIFREADHYILRCTTTDGENVTESSKRLEFSSEYPFVCDATHVLITRLMVIRNFQSVLELTDINECGHTCQVNFIPEDISFHSAYIGNFETVSIKTCIYEPNDAVKETSTKFSRSGFIIEQFRDHDGMTLYTPRLLKNIVKAKTCNSPKFLDYSPASILTNSTSVKVLQSFTPHDMQAVLTAREDTVSVQEWAASCGSFTVEFKYTFYNKDMCIFAKSRFSCSTKLYGVKTVVSSETRLSSKLQILTHKEFETNRNEELVVTKGVYVKRLNDELKVSYDTFSQIQRKEKFIRTNIDGFVTDVSYIMFLKLIVRHEKVGIFKFASINTDAVVSEIITHSLGLRTQFVDGVRQDVFAVITTTTPYKQCSTTSRMLFDKQGLLLYWGPVVENIYTFHRLIPCISAKIGGVPASAAANIGLNPRMYMLTENLFRMLGIRRDFWEGILFNEHLNIFSKRGRNIGELKILIFDHLMETEQAFKFNCFLTLRYMLITSKTVMKATTTGSLHTLLYRMYHFMKVIDEDAFESLLHVRRQTELSFDVEWRLLRGEELNRNIHNISGKDFPKFHGDHIPFIMMRYMVMKSVSHLHFVTADEEGYVYDIDYEMLQKEELLFANSVVAAWPIFLQKFCSSGIITAMVFYYNSKGHILSYLRLKAPRYLGISRDGAQKVKECNMRIIKRDIQCEERKYSERIEDEISTERRMHSIVDHGFFSFIPAGIQIFFKPV